MLNKFSLVAATAATFILFASASAEQAGGGRGGEGASPGGGGAPVSVIECFETDGGVNYGSDRLILF